MFVLGSESLDVWLSDVAVDALVSLHDTHYQVCCCSGCKSVRRTILSAHLCTKYTSRCMMRAGYFVELFPCRLSAISSAPTGASAAVELSQPWF